MGDDTSPPGEEITKLKVRKINVCVPLLCGSAVFLVECDDRALCGDAGLQQSWRVPLFVPSFSCHEWDIRGQCRDCSPLHLSCFLFAANEEEFKSVRRSLKNSFKTAGCSENLTWREDAKRKVSSLKLVLLFEKTRDAHLQARALR